MMRNTDGDGTIRKAYALLENKKIEQFKNIIEISSRGVFYGDTALLSALSVLRIIASGKNPPPVFLESIGATPSLLERMSLFLSSSMSGVDQKVISFAIGLLVREMYLSANECLSSIGRHLTSIAKNTYVPPFSMNEKMSRLFISKGRMYQYSSLYSGEYSLGERVFDFYKKNIQNGAKFCVGFALKEKDGIFVWSLIAWVEIDGKLPPQFISLLNLPVLRLVLSPLESEDFFKNGFSGFGGECMVNIPSRIVSIMEINRLLSGNSSYSQEDIKAMLFSQNLDKTLYGENKPLLRTELVYIMEIRRNRLYDTDTVDTDINKDLLVPMYGIPFSVDTQRLSVALLEGYRRQFENTVEKLTESIKKRDKATVFSLRHFWDAHCTKEDFDVFSFYLIYHGKWKFSSYRYFYFREFFLEMFSRRVRKFIKKLEKEFCLQIVIVGTKVMARRKKTSIFWSKEMKAKDITDKDYLVAIKDVVSDANDDVSSNKKIRRGLEELKKLPKKERKELLVDETGNLVPIDAYAYLAYPTTKEIMEHKTRFSCSLNKEGLVNNYE